MQAAPGYEFTIVITPEGAEIHLKQLSTGMVKIFLEASKHTVEETGGLSNHMNSLTDLQCGEWFKKRKEK